MKRLFASALLITAFLMLTGFDLDNATVPRDEILAGGPPKDGIPALLQPRFVAPSQAKFLEPDDRVIGVEIGGQARAYPIKILNWHEVINDTLNREPLVVTF